MVVPAALASKRIVASTRLWHEDITWRDSSPILGTQKVKEVMENPTRPPAGPQGSQGNGNGSRPPARRPNNTLAVFILLVGLAVLFLWFFRTGDQTLKIDYNPTFVNQLWKGKSKKVLVGKPGEEQPVHNVAELDAALNAAVAAGTMTKEERDKEFAAKRRELTNVKSVRIHDYHVTGELFEAITVAEEGAADKAAPRKKFEMQLSPALRESPKLTEELVAQGVEVRNEALTDSGWSMLLFYFAMSLVFLLLLFFFIRRAQNQMMGSGFLGTFSKSPAKRYDANKKSVTFNDVAGLENVKSDLEEIVAFLKNPEKFQRLGGRIPKGTLLVGPPGTGKTLLARAVAGEAGVPFFSINGSEFIQMFVGVGASRVRDLFQTARDNSPCILFIDEIDAVGRVRGAGLGGGHDEREQTLNQILSEMDGFTPDEAVIVVAATNRPDVLDPALLRPGRFDRHITVDRPSLKARVELFKVHCREVKIADDIDFNKLARGTVGLTGADVRNMVNEAALLATRLGKDKVDMSDFDQARDKILMGPKRDEVLSPEEKRMTAYHECGHALVAWLVPSREHVHKITVIPRGRALGVTQLMGEEDRMSFGQRDVQSRLMFLLGGRAAEKLVFNEVCAGAENDLEHATALARRMVTAWGMSERVGPVSYKTSEEHPFLGKEIHEQRHFSEHTAQMIDEEVMRILHQAADDAQRLLQKHRDKLDILAVALEQREELEESEIMELIGPSANHGAERGERRLRPTYRADAQGGSEPRKKDTGEAGAAAAGS
jgi:cell division protease FtsH